MSEQDFFFEEEPEEPAKGKPAAKSASKPSPKSASKPVAKPASKPAAKPVTRPAEPPAAVPFLESSTTMTVAILIGVVGLLVGLIGGYLLGGSQTPVAEAPATGSVGAVSPQTGTGQTAPQLTPEQLNGGQLPAGHPTIPASSTTGTGQ